MASVNPGNSTQATEALMGNPTSASQPIEAAPTPAQGKPAAAQTSGQKASQKASEQPAEQTTDRPGDKLVVRPIQYRDLDDLARLLQDRNGSSATIAQASCNRLRRWFGPLKILSWLPNPWRYLACIRVAEQRRQLNGAIQVTPINRSRTTWQVNWVIASGGLKADGNLALANEVGSQMLRSCLADLLEARTWIAETDVNDDAALALYRHNGFQPLAQLTDWFMSPELIKTLADRPADLPNWLPVSNADAQLLYQLDTVAMPPLLRQVFDRHPQDFQRGISRTMAQAIGHSLQQTECLRGYVFEPQRKAAIGYLELTLNHRDDAPHSAHLAVHPAYTWLYPELMSQMAQLATQAPAKGITLTSADYQPEREAFLERVQADRVAHRLLMSRSVWHKLRETRYLSLEGLQLSDVLPGLQPNRSPIPGRITISPPTSYWPIQDSSDTWGDAPWPTEFPR
jgi:RimJ/RimL family protein N-acetyltransferase